MRLEKIKHILVPFDFSEPCEVALKSALGLAKNTGAEIELLHVYDAPTQAFGKGLIVSSEEAVAELEKFVCDKLEARAQRIAKKCGNKVRHSARQGNAHVEIVKYAHKKRVDMIVIGTHGRSGFDYAVLGSVAERVVQRAPCPVLVVPRRRKKK